jgi:urea transport system permease protein
MPFHNPALAIGAVALAPAAVAGIVAWLIFRRRITGVYVSLITQALTLAFATFLISQQGLTGGFNGLTNFSTLLGVPLSDRQIVTRLYWITLGVLAAAYGLSQWLVRTHFGKLLIAIRDGENRVRFLGYDPMPYKVVVFALAAALAGIAGALYTLHVGVISPAMVGVVPSIEMVIWVAVGGRESLAGAVLATLAVNLAKDRISSAAPDLWLYVMGVLFILAVTVIPGGLAGWTRGIGRRDTSPEPRTPQPITVNPAVKAEEA